MHLRYFRLIALLLLVFLLLPAHPARAADPDPEIGEPAVTQAELDKSGVQPQFTGCTRANVAVQNAAYEQQVVELVNQRRAENSLPPLWRNTDLDYAGVSTPRIYWTIIISSITPSTGKAGTWLRCARGRRVSQIFTVTGVTLGRTLPGVMPRLTQSCRDG